MTTPAQPGAGREELREALALVIANATAPNPSMRFTPEQWRNALQNRFPDDLGVSRPLEAADAVLAGPFATLIAERDALGVKLDGADARIAMLGDLNDRIIHDTFGHISALRAEVTGLRARVERAINDACRMDSILLHVGEMTIQKRQLAAAVSGFIARSIRAALAPQDIPASDGEADAR